MKILTGFVIAMLLMSCAERSSDESQVRELIVTAENAAEARDASDVLDVVAADYSDSNGFDRAQLQNFLRAYFLAHPRIEVLANVQDLQFPVAGLGRARIDVTVLPSGDHAALQVEFRKEGGTWAVVRADQVRD
ncbi:MAG TPA: hypothetical protein VF033_11785 [Steroidobacteraceae bacterium]|jgi:hypothetical protein